MPRVLFEIIGVLDDAGLAADDFDRYVLACTEAPWPPGQRGKGVQERTGRNCPVQLPHRCGRGQLLALSRTQVGVG